MKKLTLIIGIMVASNVLLAQDPETGKGPKGNKEAIIEKHKERLELSDEQVEQLRDLRESLKPEFESLKNNETLSRPDKMRAHADLIEKREAEVAKILTDSQLEELEKIKEENKEKRKGRRGEKMRKGK